MAALKDEVKAFIVQALACFDKPSQVVASVKEQFKLDVTRQQVESYDPTKYAGRSLNIKWRTLFQDTRNRFREETAEIGIANRATRLRLLDRMADKAESKGNLPLAMQIIEQAAKEMGDVYVNRRLDSPHALPVSPEAGMPSRPEYVLSPDEDVPDKPIL
ncbi:DUF2280 domain-containing protein [Herbaspirillum sp. YR522]|uniref:DUF2280 domain-containing protein n=1 Tax=Herbaspirillum sp. YR522 TaxID=1144342 RepID=UPI00026FB354|nr:DUF2280 domain-containing protein [Herbaspirillum sp. YR522]EJN07801.1 hypothetical protein PMI40_01697 [Herbaspirillum sp. YR522]